MAFIRDEVRIGLWRWREAIGAGLIALVGVWAVVNGFGLIRWLGWALAGLGAALAIVAVRRARAYRGGGGIGVVQIDERRLSYFGPLSGGIIDMDDLLRLDLDPTGYPVAHWILSATGGQNVAVPVNAEGADALFDLFASLPGLRSGAVVSALLDRPDRVVTLWQRNPPRLH